MVVIVDPHLKRDTNYPVYKEAVDRRVLVKTKNGKDDYEGTCWSGSSAWVDFFNPQSWGWWKNLFNTTKLNDQFSWVESTENVHIWNDMNEVLLPIRPVVNLFLIESSLPFLMGRKPPCPRITCTTGAGNIVMSTT
jgi:alpha 1,3-glucosidase